MEYALEPEYSKEIFNSFKYTISFFKNKYENYYSEDNYNKMNNDNIIININKENNMNNDINIKVEDSKKEQLNQNKNENLDISHIPMETLHDVSKEFYQKIYSLYSNFNSCGDYLIRFTDYMNSTLQFNNFFNNLFVFGTEDFHKDDLIICDIKHVDDMINNFVTDADKFLNSKEILPFSDYLIFKNFQFFVECVKKFKLFLLGLHMDNIENQWFNELKGELIPLNCGHILFYNDRELNTIKKIIIENLGDTNEILNNDINNNDVES